MRLSSTLVSFALLFCISSVSAQTQTQDLMVGTWSNPDVVKDISNYCCIPTSIEVTCSDSDTCMAYYKYPWSMSSKCWNLFRSSTNDKTKLHKIKPGFQDYLSENALYSTIMLVFYAYNSTESGTESPKLHVYSSSSAHQCDFTMTTRLTPGTGSNYALIAIIVLVLLVVIFFGAKSYQKKQSNAIIAQQPSVYVASSNQGYVQQQQTQVASYNAPNQFPNAQVNMNYGGYNN